MSYQLGIDLGTTFTAAAVHRDGQVRTASLGTRTDAVPSVLLLRDDDTLVVGEAAERRAFSDPGHFVREFKRRFGDTTPILVGGRPYSAEALTARLLRWVVDEITTREGGPPTTTVVCHPANWGGYKIELFDQAIQLAGVGATSAITEPEAAAIHYSGLERVEPGSVVAVYDLGGGTFDAAVLRKTPSGFEVLGTPKGIERLGGIDFDAAIFGHVSNALGGRIQTLDESDPAAIAAVARLKADCVAAKEALSVDTDVTIPVILPELNTEVRLTRHEFEAMIRPSLLDSIGALRIAIESGGMTSADVSAVLLVGGSSRIPLVAQMVGSELGRPVNVDTHPKLTIALGAAVREVEPIQPEAPVPAPVAAMPSPVSSLPPPGPPTEPPASGLRPRPDPGPAPGAPPPGGRSKASTAWKLGVPALVVVAILAAAFGFLAGGGTAGAAEVLLEPITSVGQDPFTPTITPTLTTSAGGTVSAQAAVQSINPEVGETSPIDFSGIDIPAAGAGQVINVSGSAPGLYGGTNVIDVCDRSQLVEFLMAEQDKGEAWAGVQGIEFADIPAFVAGLTDVILAVDTRVTNHGFRDGSAYSLNSVLQAGTAVLVDEFGVPRVRCFCGNPLISARVLADDVEVTGTDWAGFDLVETVVITAAADAITELVIDDITSEALLARQPGSSAGTATVIAAAAPAPTTSPTTVPEAPQDTPTPVEETPTAESPTATVPPTATALPAPVDITLAGAVSASSVFGGNQFPAGLSVDGSVASAWFSAGGGSATYVWDLGRNTTFIDSIQIIGNASHETPEFRTDFGFDAVTVTVFDGDTQTYQETFGLGGTPDPDVAARPGAVGSRIVLSFTGGESADCGGFAELIVTGTPV